jgi:hypothetical protein
MKLKTTKTFIKGPMIKNRNPKNETTLKNIIFGNLRSNDEVENKQNFSKKAKTKN